MNHKKELLRSLGVEIPEELAAALSRVRFYPGYKDPGSPQL